MANKTDHVFNNFITATVIHVSQNVFLKIMEVCVLFIVFLDRESRGGLSIRNEFQF